MNTTATLAAAAIGFAVSAGSGYFLIPFLHKLHFGQTILDIGPSWHKNKQGTPTMGGFMFIIAILLAAPAAPHQGHGIQRAAHKSY